jgi:hypothetical protein
MVHRHMRPEVTCIYRLKPVLRSAKLVLWNEAEVEKSFATSVAPILLTRIRKDMTCSDLRDHSVSISKLKKVASKPPYITSSRWIVAGHSLRRLPADDMRLSARLREFWNGDHVAGIPGE